MFTEKVTHKISINHLKVEEALDANSKRHDIDDVLSAGVAEVETEEIDRSDRTP